MLIVVSKSFSMVHRFILSLFMLGESVFTCLRKFKLPKLGKNMDIHSKTIIVFFISPRNAYRCTISPILKNTEDKYVCNNSEFPFKRLIHLTMQLLLFLFVIVLPCYEFLTFLPPLQDSGGE